jgi:membrane dipeptidase
MNLPAAPQHALTIDGLSCADISREQFLRTLQGGVSTINLTAIEPWRWTKLADSLVVLEENIAKIEELSDVATVVTTVADIHKVHEDGKLGVIIGTQNSAMIEADLKLLAIFKRLGIRILQPTYNEENAFGYGASFEGEKDKGITKAGYAWIEEMYRLGLVVDLSHSGHRTTSDYLAAAKGPMVVSHANAFALCPSLRNKTDEHVRAIANTGGLIGAVLFSPLIRREERPTIEDFLDHVDYLVKLAGIEHVGVAADINEGNPLTLEEWNETEGPDGIYSNIIGPIGEWYTFESQFVADYESLTHTPRVWDGLQKRGYSADSIDKIRGGNWLHVLEDVWGA